MTRTEIIEGLFYLIVFISLASWAGKIYITHKKPAKNYENTNKKLQSSIRSI